MGAKYFGAAVRRKEDPRLLRGEGRFVDDLTLPGLLHAAFLRSPHAHARLGAIRTGAAAACPGVHRVFTFDNVARWMTPLPLFGAVPPGLGARRRREVKQAPQWALVRDVTRHVGEIVAMVVADSRALAEDACELIEVDWEPLPPVGGHGRRRRAGRAAPVPRVGRQRGGAASRRASATPTRPCAAPTWWCASASTSSATWACPSRRAAWSRSGTRATARSPPGTPRRSSHFVQQGLAGALELPAHKVRVIAPDLGGGFGTKASGYAEDLLVPVAAIECRPPGEVDRRTGAST